MAHKNDKVAVETVVTPMRSVAVSNFMPVRPPKLVTSSCVSAEINLTLAKALDRVKTIRCLLLLTVSSVSIVKADA